MNGYNQKVYEVHVSRWAMKKKRLPFHMMYGIIISETEKAVLLYCRGIGTPLSECSVCGKPLTDTLSEVVGVGPICAPRLWKKYNPEEAWAFSEKDASKLHELIRNLKFCFWIPKWCVQLNDPKEENLVIDIPKDFKPPKYKRREVKKREDDHKMPEEFYSSKKKVEEEVEALSKGLVVPNEWLTIKPENYKETIMNNNANINANDKPFIGWNFCKNCGMEFVRATELRSMHPDGYCSICYDAIRKNNGDFGTRHERGIGMGLLNTHSSCRCNVCPSKLKCHYRFHPDNLDGRCKLYMEQNNRVLPSTTNLNKVEGTMNKLRGREKLDAIIANFLKDYPTAVPVMSKSGKMFYSINCHNEACIKKVTRPKDDPAKVKGPVHALLFKIVDPNLGVYYASVCTESYFYKILPGKNNPNKNVIPQPVMGYHSAKPIVPQVPPVPPAPPKMEVPKPPAILATAQSLMF